MATRRRGWRSIVLAVSTAFLVAAGCAQILGIEEIDPTVNGGSGGSAAAGGSNSGGGGSAGDGGSAGAAGGDGPCEPGHSRDCYSGPSGTEDMGSCQAGTEQCNDAGTYGDCEGEVTPEPEDCAAASADLDCNGYTCLETIWAQDLACDDDDDTASAVAVDSEGNIYVVGRYAGSGFEIGGLSVQEAATGTDMFVAKLEPDGTAAWAKAFGGTGDDRATAVAVSAAGEVFVGGYTHAGVEFSAGPPVAVEHGLFVAKLDADGNPLVGKRITEHQQAGMPQYLEEVFRMAIGPAGSNVVYLAGAAVDELLGSGVGAQGAMDAFVVGLATDDLTTELRLWFGGPDYDGAKGIVVDADGDVYVTGFFHDNINIITGESAAGSSDAFVIKYDPGGDTVLWYDFVGDDQFQQGVDVALDPLTGDLLATGDFTGTVDFGGGAPLTTPVGVFHIYLARYAAAGGSALDTAEFGGSSGINFSADLDVDSSGRVAMAASTNTSTVFVPGQPSIGGNGASDWILLKTDSDLAPIWARAHGGSGEDMAAGIALAPDGSSVMVGHVQGTVDFGGATPIEVGGHGTSDAVVARFAP